MRSDRHRVVGAEPAPVDDAGNVVLPDDLAELAEQLQLDAQRLAECYPPRDVGKEMSDAGQDRPRQPRLGRWLLAGGVAACLLVGLRMMFNLDAPHASNRPGQLDRSFAAATVLTHEPETRETPASSDLPGRVTVDSVTPRVGPKDGDVEAPFVRFDKLSSPELEGILDLLDSQSVAISNVSI